MRVYVPARVKRKTTLIGDYGYAEFGGMFLFAFLAWKVFTQPWWWPARDLMALLVLLVGVVVSFGRWPMFDETGEPLPVWFVRWLGFTFGRAREYKYRQGARLPWRD